MNLSPHFTLEEATRSQTAARMGVANQPGPTQLANMRLAAAKLERVRSLAGGETIDVSSWLRVLPVNRAIGSKDDSAHIKGLAIDCTRRGWTPRQFFDWISQHMTELEIDQVILEFDAWVHIAFSLGTPRHQSFKIGC